MKSGCLFIFRFIVGTREIFFFLFQQNFTKSLDLCVEIFVLFIINAISFSLFRPSLPAGERAGGFVPNHLLQRRFLRVGGLFEGRTHAASGHRRVPAWAPHLAAGRASHTGGPGCTYRKTD